MATTSNPISMTVVLSSLEEFKDTISGTNTLTKHPELTELLVLATVAATGDEVTNTYIADTALPESQARGRSKAAGPAPEVAEEALRTMDPISRANGELYYPRLWGDKTYDVEILRKAREHNKNAFLYGAPGNGKTAMFEAAFGDELYTLQVTGDTDVASAIGGWVPAPGGGFTWVDGPLIRAAEEGKVFFADEIGLADPKVLAVIYSLMDGRRELRIDANPARGIVKAIEGFYVAAATNPHAPGVNMSEALISRFPIQAEVTADYELALRLGVKKQVVRAAQNLTTRMQEGVVSWAPQLRELLQWRDNAAIFGEVFAYRNIVASAPEDDREVVEEVMELMSGIKDLEPAKI